MMKQEFSQEKRRNIKLSDIYRLATSNRLLATGYELQEVAEIWRCLTCKFDNQGEREKGKPWCSAPSPPDIKKKHCHSFVHEEESVAKIRQEARPQPQTRGRGIIDFLIGFLATVVPIVGVLSFSPRFEKLTDFQQGYWFYWVFLWWVAMGLWIVAIIISIRLTRKGKRNIAKGIWVGLAVGLLVLGLSCFTYMPYA